MSVKCPADLITESKRAILEFLVRHVAASAQVEVRPPRYPEDVWDASYAAHVEECECLLDRTYDVLNNELFELGRRSVDRQVENYVIKESAALVIVNF